MYTEGVVRMITAQFLNPEATSFNNLTSSIATNISTTLKPKWHIALLILSILQTTFLFSANKGPDNKKKKKV